MRSPNVIVSCAELLYNIGKLLAEDDVKDMGDFSRLHHYHLGAILSSFSILLGTLGIGFELLSALEKPSDKTMETIEWMRRALKKHG